MQVTLSDRAEQSPDIPAVDERSNIARRHRPAEKEALDIFAPFSPQNFTLLGILDALSQRAHAQR